MFRTPISLWDFCLGKFIVENVFEDTLLDSTVTSVMRFPFEIFFL